jgi:hypothetical protein
MLGIRSRVLSAILVVLVVAAKAGASEGATLITDPDLLARLGFPRDARNVYLAKGALLDQNSTPGAPEEFGTADYGWTTVLGAHHFPETSSLSYTTFDLGIFMTGAVGGGFNAPLQMPNGALLDQVVWFGVDDDNANEHDIEGYVIQVCQTGIPTGPPTFTVLGIGSSSSESGDFVFAANTPSAEPVDNLRCSYVANTQFAVPGNDLVLRKVRARWRRQVSPAPSVATFPNDVPTTHPYFRFIEALAASGITAGCAPGSFCPNSAITRGEMAVFLAAALGLHWP